LIDHILDHLETADRYAANADRLAALENRRKAIRDLIRRCRAAADRERAEAAAHATDTGVDPQVLGQEQATWRRLRQYSLDRAEALTLADLRWLRTTARHGRVGSRNARRATELLWLAEVLLGGGAEDDPPLITDASGPSGGCAENLRDAGGVPPANHREHEIFPVQYSETSSRSVTT